MLLTVIEDLKRAEPHMGRRHPHEHRAGFDLLAVDLMVAPDDAECPRRRNPQAMHRFATEIFANRRAQTARPSPSRENGRQAPHLSDAGPTSRPARSVLSQENSAPVSQLRHIDPELMAGIEHGQWLHAGHEQAPAKHAGELRALRFFRIKVDQFGRRGIETDEIGRRANGVGFSLA